MKRSNIILGLLMAFTLSSCELVKEATETEFDAGIVKDISINLTAEDPLIEETILVNIKEDEEVDKYYDKLKDVEIERISLKIADLSATGENKMTDGYLAYSAITNAEETLLYNFQSVDLNALNSGASLDLPITADNFSKLEALLLSPGYLTFYLKGTMEEVPTTLTLLLTINTKITAGL